MPQRYTLITGATGFLGSHLTTALARTDVPIVVLKRSTSNTFRLKEIESQLVLINVDEIELREVFKKYTIDRVIHCATNYGRNNEPASEITKVNLVLPLTLLQLSVEFGVREFINTDTILEKTVNHYALSKKQFVDWMKSFSPHISCINVALEHFFGPGDDRAKFVTHLILSMLEGVETMKFTPGYQKRDFIYIDDVLSAFFCLFRQLEQERSGFRHFEIGTGNSISIREFVQLVASLCGREGLNLWFGSLPYRENETMESHVNLEPLLALGWRPRLNLEEGLLKTIAQERRAMEAFHRISRSTDKTNYRLHS